MAFNLVGFSFAFAHKEDLIPQRRQLVTETCECENENCK